jgi:hypothetical protein
MLIISVSILGLGGAMWRQKRLRMPYITFLKKYISRENPGVVLYPISLLLVITPHDVVRF